MTPFYLPLSVRRALAAILLGSFAFAARAALDAPVSPNALAGVTATLSYFNNISGQYIVSGQQERSWGYPNENAPIDNIIRITGKTPGVQGFDFLHYVLPATWYHPTSTERAIAWAQRGGIVAFCCHMFMNIGSPSGNPQFYVPAANHGVGTTFDIRQAIISGTPENQEFISKIDICAKELKNLRDAGVTVIWRPFHECSGGWFWWGAQGPEPLKEAWRIMFERYRDIHGLNNLIWCFNPTGNNATQYGNNLQAWYPGDAYVDMISIDVYPGDGTHPTYAAEYATMRNFKAGRKVVVMSENGGVPDPTQLFSTGPNAAGWGYFCTWNGFEDYNEQHANTEEFLRAVYHHPRVITLDQLASHFSVYAPVVQIDAKQAAVEAGANLTLNASTVLADPSVHWRRNGTDLAGSTTASLTLTALQPADAGLYVAVANSTAAPSAATIVGIDTANKVAGAAHEIGSNIYVGANGKTFDQVLLEGAAASIKADFSTEPSANQITRLSYIDLDDDIVQVEYSGPGTLSLVLDTPTGPAAPAKYNQSTSYMKGHASIVITGATEYSNVSVFSVGRTTAVNQALFQDGVTYDGIADLAFIAIASSNGKFGGVRTANATYFANKGLTGLYAPGVQFTGPIYLGNIAAFDAATPVILLGSSSADNRITGGDLLQPNTRAVQITGLAKLNFTAGTDSHGNALPARTNQAVLQQNGLDVTAQIIVNPTP